MQGLQSPCPSQGRAHRETCLAEPNRDKALSARRALCGLIMVTCEHHVGEQFRIFEASVVHGYLGYHGFGSLLEFALVFKASRVDGRWRLAMRKIGVSMIVRGSKAVHGGSRDEVELERMRKLIISVACLREYEWR